MRAIIAYIATCESFRIFLVYATCPHLERCSSVVGIVVGPVNDKDRSDAGYGGREPGQVSQTHVSLLLSALLGGVINPHVTPARVAVRLRGIIFFLSFSQRLAATISALENDSRAVARGPVRHGDVVEADRLGGGHVVNRVEPDFLGFVSASKHC